MGIAAKASETNTAASNKRDKRDLFIEATLISP